MNIQDLKNLIDEKIGIDDFYQMIRDENLSKFKDKTGIKAKFLDAYRTKGSGNYDGYLWRFQIGDQFYQLDGEYSSWDGIHYNKKFYEVKLIEKTIQVYERI